MISPAGQTGVLSNPKSYRGVTLVEIVISMVLVTFLSISIISAAIFSARGSRLNTNAIAAKNIAQGWFERMAADDFGNVTPPAGGIFSPTGGGYADIATTDPNPVWLDRALGIPCAIDFEFKGFGIASSGGTTSLTDSSASWEIDEWANDTVYLVDGAGSGQFVNIASNDANTLTFDEALAVSPASATKYMINNGKTVEITTTWFYRTEAYSQTVESLIINYRNDEEFGF